MSGDGHFQRVADLFEAARDLPPEHRSSFLDDECADAPAVRNEVLRLLGHHDDDAGALATPIVERKSFERIAAEAAQDGGRVPERIGRYVVQRTLGAGGMGAVYLAEQENPKRQVAVKVIRPGHLSRELLKRFELEAAMLGRLQHPGIAQIYEAGMFDDGSGGQPYFAMEYIEGPPLLEYIQERGLETRARLELFARMCDAVHHAHLKGVIHRDLKPGNILVDESGQPKILDFGVARATDSDLQVTTIQTDAAQLIGTLPYMSPEQVVGNAHDIDVRSDVYALGVILYEALAGRLPYDLAQATVITAARMIAEDEPAPLSTLNRSYRGDLNTIVLKALEKEPDRRYGSAADLAADVRRFLRDEPIVARPATTMYQLRKFTKRNKGLVAGIVVAFAVMIAGVVVTSIFAVGQTRALGESERQRKIAEAVNNFLNEDLLAQANPYTGAAHDVSLREVLEAAGDQIEDRFLDEPLVHAGVRATLGRTYFNLAMYDESERHVRAAITIYEQEEGAASLEAGNLRNTLVNVYLQDSRLDDASELNETQMNVVKGQFGEAHPLMASAHQNRAILLRKQGRVEEAVESYRTALTLFDQNPDVEARTIVTAKQNLAFALALLGQFDESEQLVQEVIDVRRTLTGPRSADVAFALNNLGDLYWRQQRYAEARPIFDEAYEIRLERLGETHLDTIRSLYAIGLIQSAERDFAAAELTHRRVLELRESELDPTHVDYMISLRAVGNTLVAQDRPDDALPLYQRAWSLAREKHGPIHSFTRNARNSVLNAMREAGRPEDTGDVYQAFFDEARTWYDEGRGTNQELNLYAWDLLTCRVEELRDPELGLLVAQRAVREGGDQDPDILDTLARALAENGRFEEAIETQQQAIALLPDDESQRERRESYQQTVADYRQRAAQGDAES